MLAKPIAAGVRSLLPSQSLSAPPQALQIPACIFDCALAIAGCAFVASGHGPVTLPFITPTSHFSRALFLAPMNFAAFLPMASWHLLTASPLPNSPAVRSSYERLIA